MMLMDISFQQQHFVKNDNQRIRRCQYFADDIYRREREASREELQAMTQPGFQPAVSPRTALAMATEKAVNSAQASLDPKMLQGIIEFVQAGNPGATLEKGVTMMHGRLKMLATASLPRDSQDAELEVRILTDRPADPEASGKRTRIRINSAGKTPGAPPTPSEARILPSASAPSLARIRK